MQKSSRINKWLSYLYDLVTGRIFSHVAWWVVFFLFLIIMTPDRDDFWFTITHALLLLVFYMGIVYFNLLYLIPEYLSKKKIFRYLILLLLSLVIATPIRTFLLYIKFRNYPELQMEVLESQFEQYIFSLIIVSASTILKIVSDWLRQQREMRDLRTQTMQSELSFLRSQINPHFLFNTLNSLYALSLKKDDKAPDIVLQLSDMMRYMLYESNEEKVPIEKEIGYMKNYLELEKLRHGPNVKIEFALGGDFSDLKIRPLLFLPFIENCFKHGVNKSLDLSYVIMKLEADDSKIEFSIKNNKPADDLKTDFDEVGGIGLQNIRRRLKLLYPGRHHLEIRETDEEFIVNLTLLHKQAKNTKS